MNISHPDLSDPVGNFIPDTQQKTQKESKEKSKIAETATASLPRENPASPSLKTREIKKEPQIPDTKYKIPKRRYAPLSTRDTTIRTPDGRSQSVHGQGKGKDHFIKSVEILEIIPMKYLPSPYKTQIEELKKFIDQLPSLPFPEEMKGGILEEVSSTIKSRNRCVAITQEGKHVILQQATRSCVPAAIAMLILDRDGTPIMIL